MADKSKVREVADGKAQFTTLASDERQQAHELIDAGIADLASRTAFGSAARATGQTTVAIDDHGDVVERPPDTPGS